MPNETPENPEDAKVEVPVTADVAQKINDAHNVLVALSADPSVDEMAAAIGISLYLDRLGKRATAIYSGATPNALEFLKPEETFEDSVDTLQDFVIALNKEKADHLRYKLDGDYVKIFITPYKTRIAEDDLEFSYGDFNVDLVLALDVANGVDLDSALREHGRIMHDAVIVNITTGNPGKLGEIEWSDKTASSVSEMIAKLLYGANSKIQIEKEEATAFLTGIVAATNRFSNAKTTPETMTIASKLMKSGANQQLISKNITPDVENEVFSMPGFSTEKKNEDGDPSKLDIQHGNEVVEEGPEQVESEVTEKESTLLDDLKAAEASLAAAGAETVPEEKQERLEVDSSQQKTPAEMAEEIKTQPAEVHVEENEPETVNATTTDAANTSVGNMGEGEMISAGEEGILTKPEKILQPTGELGSTAASLEDDQNKYGKMLEDALAATTSATTSPVATPMESPVTAAAAAAPAAAEAPVMANPAAMGAPVVAAAPEINGVPEINYMPMPDEGILPPPPTPPIDMSVPAEPTVEPTMPTIEQASIAPAMPVTVPEAAAPEVSQTAGVTPDQVYAPQATNPGAFKIPGM